MPEGHPNLDTTMYVHTVKQKVQTVPINLFREVTPSYNADLPVCYHSSCCCWQENRLWFGSCTVKMVRHRLYSTMEGNHRYLTWKGGHTGRPGAAGVKLKSFVSLVWHFILSGEFLHCALNWELIKNQEKVIDLWACQLFFFFDSDQWATHNPLLWWEDWCQFHTCACNIFRITALSRLFKACWYRPLNTDSMPKHCHTPQCFNKYWPQKLVVLSSHHRTVN